jgi:hypothetical protein
MNKEWLTLEEATLLVRERLASSEGRAQLVLRNARASGEVRFSNPADPVLLMADDGVVGMHLRHCLPRGDRSAISRDDLIYWLDRNFPCDRPSTQTKKRSQNKRARAAEAIQAIWQDSIPSPTHLSNAELCKKVSDWIKTDCQAAGVTIPLIGDDTILRAAGRKRA